MMRRTVRAAFAAAAMLAPAVAPAQTPEIRALWVSRFEWPSANQATCKANLDAIMNTAAANRFNTIFLQVRGDCTTYYPSPDEPWASTFSYTNPGWDPLAYAINSAHAKGLKLHAYINTHTITSVSAGPPVTTPQHVYHLHGPTTTGTANWASRDSTGASPFSEYYWLSPGVPEASAWTRKQILHVVKNYDVDGVHFDRIRTEGAQYSHDPVTAARFSGDGNPDNLSWEDFMRSQITRDLRNIYGEIAYHKPNVLVSAAPIGICLKDATTHYQGTGTQSYSQYYQDSWGWLQAGVLDFAVPQIYWNIGSAHPFELLLQDWMEHRGQRWIVPGSTTGGGTETLANLLAEQQETRNQSASGHCIFSYGSMGSYWGGFASGPYAQAAAFPTVPWRATPTRGHIVGYVKDSLGNPVVDAKINLAGDPYNYLSANDGFFSMINVTTGTAHSITASKAGKGTGHVTAVSVAEGSATMVQITLSLSRGTLSFSKPAYETGERTQITLEDADLAGTGSTTVTVASTVEPAGESVALTEGPSATFTGALDLWPGAPMPGDSRLAVTTGSLVTATYVDADTGGGNPGTATTTATVVPPATIIIESVRPDNTVNGPPDYTESVGANTWGYTSAKSPAPGLVAPRGRYTGNNAQGAYAVFTPDILSPGSYDVQITLPTAAVGVNNHSPGAGLLIQHDGPDITGPSFDLSRFNTALEGKWFTLATGVKFARGRAGSVRITNNHTGTADSGNRFDMDAVRFVFIAPADVPVSVSRWGVE